MGVMVGIVVRGRQEEVRMASCPNQPNARNLSLE